MGILENREYFEKLSKVVDNRVGTEPGGVKTATAPDQDMAIEHQIGLKAVGYSATSDEDDSTPYRATKTSSHGGSNSGSRLNRPSMLKKRRPSQSNDNFKLKIGISVLAWVLVFQVIYMVSLFNVTQTPSKVRIQQGKVLSLANRAYIICVLALSACIYGWMCYSVWSRQPCCLLLTVIMNFCQLIAFIFIPVIYFNTATNYRQCFGAQDCLRYTIPIALYIITDLGLLVAFWFFAYKKYREDPRTIRFNLA